MSALGRRVALMRKIKEFQKWRASMSECSEQQSALSKGWVEDLQSKVSALIHEPIPLKQDDFYQSIVGGAKFADRTGYLEQHPPISGRVIRDELQSVSKLKISFTEISLNWKSTNWSKAGLTSKSYRSAFHYPLGKKMRKNIKR
ncbi:hypothetical protein BJN45_01465 [Azonexus hydrophilus]|uniref:Uncharacterized protein n=2 Tax=Azonexus hydrophilus TaxID=418702 RepID=A0A1R1IC70_9RHOO|nr:hypothetical protein BJN45_01465 [Azonexus hydrophilus]